MAYPVSWIPADWPTTDDLIARLNLPSSAEPDADLIESALTAAMESIAGMCALPFVDEDDVATQIPSAVRLAILMQAFRWYKRKDSPEGVIGSNEQGTIYVQRIDSDVMQMIAQHRDWFVV